MAGRPMSFDRDDAVRRALDAIWKEGYAAASVKSMSELLGITRSSFYNTFGSRDALLRDVLERYITLIPEARLFGLTETDPFAPALTSVVRSACEVRGGDPERRGCLAANAIAEVLPSEDEAGALVLEMSRATQDHLERLVVWAQKRGEIDLDADPRGMALAIHGMIMGLNLQSKFVADVDELWRSAQTSLKALGLYAEEQ